MNLGSTIPLSLWAPLVYRTWNTWFIGPRVDQRYSVTALGVKLISWKHYLVLGGKPGKTTKNHWAPPFKNGGICPETVIFFENRLANNFKITIKYSFKPRKARKPFTRLREKRVNWKSHAQWNTNMLCHQTYRKKSLRKLQSFTAQERLKLEERGIDQTIFEKSTCPLEIEGVIYAIVHVPSNKIYVGQSINSAYQRLKNHWRDRLVSKEPPKTFIN